VQPVELNIFCECLTIALRIQIIFLKELQQKKQSYHLWIYIIDPYHIF